MSRAREFFGWVSVLVLAVVLLGLSLTSDGGSMPVRTVEAPEPEVPCEGL